MLWRKKSQAVVDRPRYAGFTVYRVEREGHAANILSFVPKDPAFSSGIPIEAHLAPDRFQAKPKFLEFFHLQVARML